MLVYNSPDYSSVKLILPVSVLSRGGKDKREREREREGGREGEKERRMNKWYEHFVQSKSSREGRMAGWNYLTEI